MEESLPIAAPVHSVMEPEQSGAEGPRAQQAVSPSSNTERRSTLGPWYHTAGIVVLLLVYSFVAHLTHHQAMNPSASRVDQVINDTAHALAETPKIPLYSSNIMLSWLLLSAVVAGLYHRRSFFRSTLRSRFQSGWVDVGLGFAIYVSFLILLSLLVLLFSAALTLRANHPSHSAAISTQAHPGGDDSTTDSPDDALQRARAVRQRVQHLLHVNHDAVASLAPHTVPELLLWIGLSFTAGFCEEHIFRGYLLSQALAALRRSTLPSWLVSTLAVLATSVLFGGLHLYEGVGGAVIVGMLGAVFAVATLLLGNLRAVIFAHFLQDFFGGLVYYIAHLRHAV